MYVIINSEKCSTKFSSKYSQHFGKLKRANKNVQHMCSIFSTQIFGIGIWLFRNICKKCRIINYQISRIYFVLNVFIGFENEELEYLYSSLLVSEKLS